MEIKTKEQIQLESDNYVRECELRQSQMTVLEKRKEYRRKIERKNSEPFSVQQKYSLMRNIIKNYYSRTAIPKSLAEVYKTEPVQIHSLQFIDDYFPVSISCLYNYSDETYTFTISYPENPALEPFEEPWHEVVYKSEPGEICYAQMQQVLIFIQDVYTSDHM